MRPGGRILYEISAVPTSTTRAGQIIRSIESSPSKMEAESGFRDPRLRLADTSIGRWPMVDADTILVSIALVATSINTLLTTFTLLHQVNEKTKLLKTLHTVSSALIIVAKKGPLRAGIQKARHRLADSKIAKKVEGG